MFGSGCLKPHSQTQENIALSSAEAEYNEACLACMATNHLAMILDELEGRTEPRKAIPILLDSKSAIAMGNSFKDTKHTRHIMGRYHYVREGVDSGRFTLHWIGTDDMLSDIGTKQTPGPRHTLLTNLILVPVKETSKAAFIQLIQYKRGDSF